MWRFPGSRPACAASQRPACTASIHINMRATEWGDSAAVGARQPAQAASPRLPHQQALVRLRAYGRAQWRLAPVRAPRGGGLGQGATLRGLKGTAAVGRDQAGLQQALGRAWTAGIGLHATRCIPPSLTPAAVLLGTTHPPHRYPIDYNNAANTGLVPPIQALKEYKKTRPNITWADLATLGVAVAAEAAGGERRTGLCACVPCGRAAERLGQGGGC